MTRDLEQSAREILAVLQAVHQSPGPEGILISYFVSILSSRYFLYYEEGDQNSIISFLLFILKLW